MKLRLALFCCVLALGACSKIGSGNKLESLRFTSASDGTVALATEEVFQCFPQTLTLVGEFTDHSLGNFTQRGAVYTTSDSSKVQVSNGDIPVPGFTNQFFARGVMIAGASGGPVTITGSFAGLSASVNVNVIAPGMITVSPSTLDLAPSSFGALTANTTFKGLIANVSQLGSWTFDSPNDSIATINAATGIVSAVSAPGTLTARFGLSTCAGSPLLSGASATVNVATIDHLSMRRDLPGQPIIVSTTPTLYPTTDRITTTAVLTGGASQDLSFQVTLALTPTTTVNLQLVAGNLLRAIQEGPGVTVASSFVSAGRTFNATLDDTTLPPGTPETILAKNATLTSVAIAAGDRNPIITGFGTYAFHAIGTFVDASSNSFTRDISRHVSWTSSDTTKVGIINSYSGRDQSNGFARSLQNDFGCVTITADTGVVATPLTTTLAATTSLSITPGATPSSPNAAGCTP